MMEVELGKLAVEKANHKQVKAFGWQMQDDHGKANSSRY
jgi:predicted outer membrane protein